MEKITKQAIALLESNESFVLASVVDKLGSAPRGAGTKMIIKRNGRIFGTIGGGLVESEVQKKSATIFKSKKSMIQKFHLNKNEVSEMDMICGGELTVVMQYIDALDHFNVKLYKEIALSIENYQNAWIVTMIDKDESGCLMQSFLMKKDGYLIGAAKEDFNEDFVESVLNTKKYSMLMDDKKNGIIVEPIGDMAKAHIYGAGHIAEKLVPLLNYVDFYTNVYDDREKFANKERFPKADQISVLDSFENVFENKKIDRGSYIIIVTRGHAYDQTLLAQALKTDAGYIGMIGSKKKRETIYNALICEGVTTELLSRVHAPIGLGICAETPEEISISIVAQLIEIRAELRA